MNEGVNLAVRVATILTTGALLLVTQACAAGPQKKTAAPSLPNAPTVEVAFELTDLGPPGDEDTASQLTLVWGEAGGKKNRHVLKTLKAVCSHVPTGKSGPILLVSCWRAGQGAEFRLLQRDGQLVVEQEDRSEEESVGKPPPPQILHRITVPAGARVQPLPR